jgi:hypothetical protein
MDHASNDTVVHLTEELERVHRALAELQNARPQPRRGGPRNWSGVWVTVPLLLGTWLLSAQTPADQDDLEKRVSELEARLLKGPGTTTRIQAPFEVVGAGGNVILQVTQGLPTVNNGVGIFSGGKLAGVAIFRGGHDIAGLGTTEEGKGGLVFATDENGPDAEMRGGDGVRVLNGGGQVVAAMEALDEPPFGGRFAVMHGDKVVASLEEGDEGGLLDVSDEKGKSVAQLAVEDGNGYVSTLDPKGYAEVSMEVSEKGEPRLSVREKGKVRASLGLTAGAGVLSISNSKGSAVANVRGDGTKDGGAVIVGNGSGQGVANMTSGADGLGLIQVFQPGGKSLAVLTQDKQGGFLQIKNESGTPVANLKASTEGAGYWQLTDPGGNPVVEGGFDEGLGIVRAGPLYRCSALAQAVPLVGTVRLPDCIRGRNK